MVTRKEKIKKIAFSLAEAMISMLIISAIATMSIKLFAGQKTKKAADMAHHIMGCYITEDYGIAAMSMEIGKPNTLQIEGFKGNGAEFQAGPAAVKGNGIGNIKLYLNNGRYEGKSNHFKYNPTPLPTDSSNIPFCAMDVTETLSSTAKTVAMIGGGGFGFMSDNATYAYYNRPGDSGYFATFTNLDFTRPGVYRLYPGLPAEVIGTGNDARAIGTSENRQGKSSKLVYVPATIASDGTITETYNDKRYKKETLAEVRGGYSRNHYYPLGGIPITDIGCDDSQSCRFEGTELHIAKERISDVRKRVCGNANDKSANCNKKIQDAGGNWSKYASARDFLKEAKYKNYITKTVSKSTGDETVSQFIGRNNTNEFNDYYKGGTMIATATDNHVIIGMNDLAPRCTNDMYEFLKLTANSGTPTIFTGADSYLYSFGTGGACSNYHNASAGNNAMRGTGGAVFVIW